MRIFVLTRGYPAAERLYNHSFVHRRVLAYRALGHEVCVFWNKHRGELSRYDFQGIEVMVGGPEACLAAIADFGPDAIAAHAMADDFWPVLSQLPEDLPVNAWIYGAEILPFFAVTQRAGHDAARAEKAKAVFERRIAFWRRLAADWPRQLRLVFVSRYAAEAAEHAVGSEIPRWLVQRTGIDQAMFPAREKAAEDRYRILSIRPFSDWRYANDLSVAAILQLRERADFARFQFHFVGDGHLFDEILAPVRDLPNVRCEQRFLTQADIAELHAQNGVFLCPSRDDAQGVSRDEAMSSGLVPIVSRAGAVPEFVDSQSGLLVAPEDAAGLAAAMARLADEPATFQRLSQGAAAKVQRHIAMREVVAREIEILRS